MMKKPIIGWVHRKELIKAGIIRPVPKFSRIIYKDSKPHTLVVRLDGKEVI